MLAHVSQPRTTVVNPAWGSSLETRNKIQDRIAHGGNETKKETVLRAFGKKRPRKETLLVALA
jgi:hypothetical protein